jgi:uncharacterized membrane protein YkoI
MPSSHVFAYTGEKLAQGAKITIEQARAIALQARAGAITDEELEREKGGSGLRYSFDIKSDGAAYEVGVDAQTGKVLEKRRRGGTQIEDIRPAGGLRMSALALQRHWRGVV